VVGGPAGDEGSHHRADQQDRDRELLLAVAVQPEVLLHEEHRAADHAGVVAEQETADRGDDRDAEQAAVVERLPEEPLSRVLGVRHVQGERA
jgi:hypothetical protein